MSEDIEFKDRGKSITLKMSTILIVGIYSAYIPIWAMSNSPNPRVKETYPILVSIFIIVPLAIIIPLMILLKYTIPKSTFKISNNKIEVLIEKEIYFEVFWDKINEIFEINEKYFYPQYPRGNSQTNGYKLHFKGKNTNKNLRLWPLPYNKKSRRKIRSVIKEFSEKLNIQYFEDHSVEELTEKQSLTVRWKPERFSSKIRRNRKNNKKINKK